MDIKSASYSGKICFFSLCAFVFISGIFPGSGIVSFYGLSARLLFAAISFITILPWLLLNYRLLIKDMFFKQILLFGLILGVNFLRSYFLGHEMHFANDLIKGSSFFLLYFAIKYAVRSAEQLSLLLKIMVASGTVTSITTLLLVVFAKYVDGHFWKLVEGLMPSYSVGVVYLIEDGLPRIQFSGIIGQFFSIAIIIYYCYGNDTKEKLIYYTCGCLNIVAIIYSFSRGIFAALLVLLSMIVVLTALFSSTRARMISKEIFCLLLGSLFIVIALSGWNKAPVVSYAAYRCTINTAFEGLGENLYSTEKRYWETMKDNRDIDRLAQYMKERESGAQNIRNVMSRLLLEEINKSPIIGNGLAASIKLRDGKVEMVYHDLINKIGIVGLVAFFLPLICALYMLCNKLRNGKAYGGITNNIMLQIPLYSAFVALCVASYSNPYIINSVGMFFYSLILCLADKSFLMKLDCDNGVCLK